MTALLEAVVDDLLLSVDQVTAGDTSTLTSRVADRIAELSLPSLTGHLQAHPSHRKAATAVATLLAAATSEYVATQALLAAGLLAWAAEQTGLPVGEVLAGVRDQHGGDR